MFLFLQQLMDGFSSGAIYASLALALVFSFRSTRVVNFAQGEMAMFSTYLTWQFHTWGAPIWEAIGFALIISFAGGGIVYVVLIRPIAKASPLTVVTVTVGLFAVFNSLAGFIWSYMVKQVPSAFPNAVWRFGSVQVSAQAAGIIPVLVVTVLLLYLLFEHTKLGLGMRAAALEPEGSRLVGIRVGRMHLLGWGLSASLGALSGAMVAPRLFLDPNMMIGVIIYAFAAATLGGFNSPQGAVIGGLIVGVAENMAGTYLSWIGADLKIIVPLLIIFVVLLIKPSGLFDRQEISRV